MKLVSTNPADNYKVIGEVESSTPDEIKSKVAAAHKAKDAWKNLGVEDRIELLRPIRDEFNKRVDEIARMISVETGKAISESTSEVERYIDNDFDWYLNNGAQALTDQITLRDDQSLHGIVYE